MYNCYIYCTFVNLIQNIMTIFEGFKHNANINFTRRYEVNYQVFNSLLYKIQIYIDKQKNLKPMSKRGCKATVIKLEQKLK